MIIISADELPRFMMCNGSRLLSGEIPTTAPTDTTARDEGTAAHYMATVAFSGQHTVEELVDRKAPNGTYMTSDMAEHVTAYNEILRSHAFMIGVEIDTSHDASPNWAIKGRCDFAGLKTESHLHIVDFKYGYRIVEPDENWTLISHAIGVLKQHQQLKIDHVSLSIFQPRPYHPEGKLRTVTMEARELNDAFQTLNLKLVNPSDELRTSNHCGYCPAMAQCPAARLAQFNAIDASETVYSDEINNDVLTQTLETLYRAQDMLEQRLKAFEELAKYRIKGGQVVKNYSVEMGLGHTRWKEGLTPELLNALTGKNLEARKLVTPAEAKRLGVDPEVIKPLTERPSTGIKLVRIDANKKAARIFEGKKGN